MAISGGLSAGCGQDRTAPTPTPPPPPAPLSVTSVFPPSGSTFGATTATITGTGFQAGAVVTLDGAEAKVTTLGRTGIAVTVPPHAPGPVDIVVVNPSGDRASAAGGYTYVVSPLRTFKEPDTGFSTSDLYDAEDEVVQINTAGHLIVPADGIGLPGHSVTGGNFGEIYIPVEALCACWLEVRFGMKDGERRAYLTAEYGHHNPGTLVDVDFTDGLLVVSQTTRYPPGMYVLSGVVTELTAAGAVPVEGLAVNLLVGGGFRTSTTDSSGNYQIAGLHAGQFAVSMDKDGYEHVSRSVSMSGDTRLDVQLVRR
jgi:hypothetical protein